MAKIILLSYGGGHVNMLLPVIRSLQTQGHQLIVFGLTTAGAVLTKQGIPFKGFKDLLPLSDQADEAVRVGKQLAGEADPNAAVPYEESVAYMGLSYLDMEEQLGKAQAEEVFANRGRQAFYPLPLMKKLLSHEQPDLVLATNSPRAERALIEAAGELSIPAVCLVDLFATQGVAWLGQPTYADQVCVLSEDVKQTLVDAGRTADSVVVTGNPAFDFLVDVKQAVAERRKAKQRDPQRYTTTVLWASQPEPKTHPFTGQAGDERLPRQVEAQLLLLAEQYPDWQWVFRPHPSEVVAFTQLPTNVRISDRSESLHDLLKMVDLVITMTSTVGLEAVLVDLPLVTVDLSVFSADSPYTRLGYSVGVTQLEHLEQAIHTALAREVALSLPAVGGSAARIVRVIEELLAPQNA